MGNSLDETERFYFTAGWIFAVQFFLPPEANMLSSESIIHKPDTSSALLQIIQQQSVTIIHHTWCLMEITCGKCKQVFFFLS